MIWSFISQTVKPAAAHLRALQLKSHLLWAHRRKACSARDVHTVKWLCLLNAQLAACTHTHRLSLHLTAAAQRDGLTCQPNIRCVSNSHSLFLCVEPVNQRQTFSAREYKQPTQQLYRIYCRKTSFFSLFEVQDVFSTFYHSFIKSLVMNLISCFSQTLVWSTSTESATAFTCDSLQLSAAKLCVRVCLCVCVCDEFNCFKGPVCSLGGI